MRSCGIPFMLHGMADPTVGIADKVRGVAAEKRYTQQRIATALGIGRTSVAERINGRIPFTGSELLTLANEMGVSVSRFFPESDELQDRSTPEAMAS